MKEITQVTQIIQMTLEEFEDYELDRLKKIEELLFFDLLEWNTSPAMDLVILTARMKAIFSLFNTSNLFAEEFLPKINKNKLKTIYFSLLELNQEINKYKQFLTRLEIL